MSNVHNPASGLSEDSATGLPVADKSTGGAKHVTPVNPVTGLPFGVINGGTTVASTNEPARDYFIDWFFGADTTASVATLTANQWTAPNVGLSLELGLINPAARSMVIICTDATPAFHYKLSFSRDGVNDFYEVIASTASTSKVTSVPLPASLGYDIYCRLDINPDTGQTGNQLKFKAYLAGRGG